MSTRDHLRHISRRIGQRIPFLALLALPAAAAIPACSSAPAEDAAVETSQAAITTGPTDLECDVGGEETLEQFSASCAAAMEMGTAEIPTFDCAGANAITVPTTGVNGALCDRPNTLNRACDPGSTYQVVLQKPTASKRGAITFVANCRVKGAPTGSFNDVAMIAYNSESGDTCFFQNKLGTAVKAMPSPSRGEQGVWQPPAKTAQDGCIGCHDSGPFLRTPYLSQLTGTYLTERGESAAEWEEVTTAQKRAAALTPQALVPGARSGGAWNHTNPYRFVGRAFQSWRSYEVSLVDKNGTQNDCLGCHNLGMGGQPVNGGVAWISNTERGVYGTLPYMTPAMVSVDAPTSLDPKWLRSKWSKNPHGRYSPRGMKTTYGGDGTDAEGVDSSRSAVAMVACGDDWRVGKPARGCAAFEYGRGNTCRNGAIVGTIHGATPTEQSGDLHEKVVIPGGAEIGFIGWRAFHGPLGMDRQGKPVPNTPDFLGTYARLGAENGNFVIEADNNLSTGARVAPGGTYAITRFSEIATVPDPSKCGTTFWTLKNGGDSVRDEVVADPDGLSLNLFAGAVGNASPTALSSVRLLRTAPKTTFVRTTDSPSPYAALLTTNGCANYVPDYYVRDRRIAGGSDVQIVPAADALKVSCLVSGIEGDWSGTAGIVIRSGGARELRATMTGTPENTFAYVSCLRLRP